ncbi:MAG: hypothetical protein ABSB82_09170 [Terriglobia bacterium]
MTVCGLVVAAVRTSFGHREEAVEWMTASQQQGRQPSMTEMGWQERQLREEGFCPKYTINVLM